MDTMFRNIAFVIIALCSMTAHAANWKVFNTRADNRESVEFVDADTVVKTNDKITIWEKIVLDEDAPIKGTAYSWAERIVFSCKNKTTQTLQVTSYDKSHNFIETYDGSKPELVIPGSIMESILTEVCTKGFPENLYPAINNDVYETATVYFDYIKHPEKYDPAPK